MSCLLLCPQAAEEYGAAVSKLDSAAAALTNMAAGFQLEDATSRLSSAAPPSPLVLAGQCNTWQMKHAGRFPNMPCSCCESNVTWHSSLTRPCGVSRFHHVAKVCDLSPAGVPQHQVAELSKSFPALTSSSSSATPRPAIITAEALVRELASLLDPAESSAPGQRLASQRLQMIAHNLPHVLSGALLDLLAARQSSTPSADLAVLQRHQQRLQTFMSVLDAELPRLTAQDSSVDGDSSSSGWSAGGTAGASVSGAEGVLELLGAQDTCEVLQHAGELGDKRSEHKKEQGIYEQLADIHHDGDVQRYLQVSNGQPASMNPAPGVAMTHRVWESFSAVHGAPLDSPDVPCEWHKAVPASAATLYYKLSYAALLVATVLVLGVGLWSVFMQILHKNHYTRLWLKNEPSNG